MSRRAITLAGDQTLVAGRSDPEGSELVRVSDLAKSFGPTQAVRSCSFTVRAGDVHAVIGENGSGKSTVVKMLTGVVRPDRGTIEVGGVSMPALPSPRAALEAGIVGVFQNIMMLGPRSVLDNLWLGHDGLFRQGASDEVRRRRGREVLAELLEHPPDLEAPAESLPLSERQACAIARALLRDPRVLILDEATSALDVATRDRLFAVMRRLTAAGRSVIFISHRMDEIAEVSNLITVMRAGESVATVGRDEVPARELIRMMTGAEHLPEAELLQARSRRVDRSAQPVLRARGLVLRAGAQEIDEGIRPGELVGLAGLEGHGQEQFLHALAGARTLGGQVLVADGSEEVRIGSRAQATAHGIAYVPRDRQRAGLFSSLSIRDNFALPTLAADRSAGLISHSRSGRRLAGYVKLLNIRLGDPADQITTLSGGNQQKVVLARWLAGRPRVLLLNDPTRGIDPGAKHDLYRLLAELTGEGLAVVMLSTDLDELLDLMHRVLVFREGTVFCELPGEGLTRQALVSSFFGGREGTGG